MKTLNVEGREVQIRPITRREALEMNARDVDFFKVVQKWKDGEPDLSGVQTDAEVVLDVMYPDMKDHFDGCNVMQCVKVLSEVILATVENHIETKN